MFKNYNFSFLKYDIKAGLAVAALSLPIGVAYSEMLGLPPESGIFTAIFSIVCYFISGTSKELIIGPDSAVTALLASSIFALNEARNPDFDMQFIVLTTFVTGIMFFASGFLRLGFISNFLSRPILVGFLNGVAAVLIISQITKFTGVKIHFNNSIIGLFEFLGKISQIHVPTLLIGCIALFLMIVLSSSNRRIPSQILVTIISVVGVLIFDLSNLGIEFSPELESSIPVPLIPDLSLFENTFDEIIIDASAILFLSFTNTILVARAFSRDKNTLNPDKEFFAMGLANIVCGIFRGFPASGSTSRTVINISEGSKTKFSMLFAAIAMTLVVIFLSKEFSLIPSVVFAAIIIDAAIGMFNFLELKEIRVFSKKEFIVSLICMIGVTVMGVLDGILIALVMSFINLIRRSSHPSEYELVYDRSANLTYELNDKNAVLANPEIILYRFNSPMLFYNFDYFRKKILKRCSDREQLKLIVIDCAPINYIDITFRNELADLIMELERKKIYIIFANATESFQSKLKPALTKLNLKTEIFFPDFASISNFVKT